MRASSALHVRTALPEDIHALTALITRSARLLSRGYYTEAETESAIRHVFGVDSTLVADRTYFVVEDAGVIVGCGGWSRRRTLYGGDQRPVGLQEMLDPDRDAARIRAFFIAPEAARQGVGRCLFDACISAAAEAGFHSVELMSTLPGVPSTRRWGVTRLSTSPTCCLTVSRSGSYGCIANSPTPETHDRRDRHGTFEDRG